MQIAVKIINLIFILTLLLSCEGNDVTKGKDTETPQGLSSLVGTEWVHREDTDPESQNWFNLLHSPFHFNTEYGNSTSLEFEFESPSVIKFLENGVIDEPSYKYYLLDIFGNKSDYFSQYYRYSYNEPYVYIIMMAPLRTQQELHPSEVQMESVEERQKKWNLCPVTIDEPRCDSSKCKNSIPGTSRYCKCCCDPLCGYWFLGKVEGDTMHLQELVILDNNDIGCVRDIYLVRRK